MKKQLTAKIDTLGRIGKFTALGLVMVLLLVPAMALGAGIGARVRIPEKLTEHVVEYVEAETLAKRLDRGRLPLHKAPTAALAFQRTTAAHAPVRPVRTCVRAAPAS